jgi:hypothetical protein
MERRYVAKLRGFLLHSALTPAILITLLNSLKPLHVDDTA